MHVDAGPRLALIFSRAKERVFHKLPVFRLPGTVCSAHMLEASGRFLSGGGTGSGGNSERSGDGDDDRAGAPLGHVAVKTRNTISAI